MPSLDSLNSVDHNYYDRDHDHQKIIIRKSTSTVIERKPLMQLKDYLLDDLSSCSSNGFKSFPRRRQCCTTVRFLLELDLKQKDHRPHDSRRGRDRRRALRKSRSKTASITISALQRASDAFINAVKSPCRKLFKSRFWGKSDGRPRLLLAEVVEERCGPSDQNASDATNGDKSKSTISWCESEFGNSEVLFGSSSSSGQSSAGCSTENDVVESEKDVSFRKVNKKIDISVGEDSTTQGTTTTKEWSNEEEKEQFSPVSVLDCPFEDDDHISSPNFHHKITRLEGTKQKITQKARRFENIAQLAPVDLEKRIAMSEIEDKPLTRSLREDDADQEEKTREMMKAMKIKSDWLVSKAENLIFDFFTERLEEESDEKEAVKVMEDWINGETRQVFLGWEVKEGRKAYVKDMEKCGRWVKLDHEIQEIGLDLEAKILDSLLQELLLDLL